MHIDRPAMSTDSGRRRCTYCWTAVLLGAPGGVPPGGIRTCDAWFRNATQREFRCVVRTSKRASDLGKCLILLVGALRCCSIWRVQNVYRSAMFGFQIHQVAGGFMAGSGRGQHLKLWEQPDDYEQRIASATKAAAFALWTEELHPDMKRRVLKETLWFVSENPGKWTTRYRSAAAWHLQQSKPSKVWMRLVAHEHVWTRRSLAQRLEQCAHLEGLRAVLEVAQGCVVLRTEHSVLTPFDKDHDGWDRYCAARIDVVDRATGEPLIVDGQFTANDPIASPSP